MKKFLQTTVLTMLLVLAAAPAWALGLGQLQLKSKLGEPLLAEIPVISANPAELENLQARLAAPDTFLRVGLPLPDRMVSDLRFALVYDDAGKPLIQVTSPGPVAMPMLTFLLEVDWGDGRLVREYSVLLAEPEAVAAATQPLIEAPIAAPSNTIVRDTAPMPAPAAPIQSQPQPTPSSAPVQASAAPVITTNTAVAATGRTQRTVQAGDTLSGLASQVRSPGQSIHAVMAALLRANPEAFINNDPNLLRRGATLSMPVDAAVAEAERDGSVAALQEQLAGWRGNRTRVTAAVDVASANDMATSPTPARTATPRRAQGARLEIMPATASAAAGTGARSGTGGEGDAEMTQQLQEARETIATRDAEIAELKSRLTELENLQKQQGQLIQMKDGQLAAAQQQLQQRQQNSQPVAAPTEASAGSAWFLGMAIGLPLLVVLALGAWWMRRRPVVVESDEPSFTKAAPVAPAKPEKTRLSDQHANLFPSETDAAPSTPTSAPSEAPVVQPLADAASSLRKPSWMGVAGQGDDVLSASNTLPPSVMPSAQSQRASEWTNPGFASHAKPVTPDAVPSIQNDPMPRELPAGLGVFDAPEQIVQATSLQHRQDERIALANTYLELDDATTARQLLQEVIAAGGADADEAQRVLARIDSLP